MHKIREIMTRFPTALSILLVLFFAAHAVADPVNIDSKMLKPAIIFLTAGTYHVSPKGTADGSQYRYTAWNAWGSVSACDPSGKNCRKGWLNSWRIFSEELSPTAGSSDKGVYQTKVRALSHAKGLTFTISYDQDVYFYIDDPDYLDNMGGISLQVNPVQK